MTSRRREAWIIASPAFREASPLRSAESPAIARLTKTAATRRQPPFVETICTGCLCALAAGGQGEAGERYAEQRQGARLRYLGRRVLREDERLIAVGRVGQELDVE